MSVRSAPAAPMAVALDTADLVTAVRWAAAVAPYVSTFKVGLELFSSHGRDAVHAIRRATGHPIFLDLKLHDIPNTVAGAARGLADLELAFVTVHASGGTAMIEAAARALPQTRIAAVTVLTSLSDTDLEQIGLAGPALDAARRLAALAVGAGARALVCSPHEVGAIRREVGPDIVLITPGVRPARPDALPTADDQARVDTPGHALAAGADLVVVGRPITAAADPAAAARELAASLAAPIAG